MGSRRHGDLGFVRDRIDGLDLEAEGRVVLILPGVEGDGVVGHDCLDVAEGVGGFARRLLLGAQSLGPGPVR